MTPVLRQSTCEVLVGVEHAGYFLSGTIFYPLTPHSDDYQPCGLGAMGWISASEMAPGAEGKVLMCAHHLVVAQAMKELPSSSSRSIRITVMRQGKLVADRELNMAFELDDAEIGYAIEQGIWALVEKKKGRL